MAATSVLNLIATAKAYYAQYGNCGAPVQQQAATLLAAAIAELERQMASNPEDDDFRKAAEEIHAAGSSGDIEIEDDAIVSRGDHGAFVQAWVYVTNAAVGISEPEDDDEGGDEEMTAGGLTAGTARDFAAYLRNCTDAQVQGVYEKERAAGRGAYVMLALTEAARRGLTTLA